MNTSLIHEVIDYYKKGKLNKSTVEHEISNNLGSINHINIIFDEKAKNLQSSYIATIVPEQVNGVIRLTYIFDNNIIENVLESDDFVNVLDAMMDKTQSAIMKYLNFVNKFKDTEVPFSDCVKLLVTLQLDLLEYIDENNNDTFIAYIKNTKNVLENVIMSIEYNTESQARIIEELLLKNALPEISLKYCEKLFKELNVPDAKIEYHDVKDLEKPDRNIYYASMASYTSGIINPEYREEYDPNLTTQEK